MKSKSTRNTYPTSSLRVKTCHFKRCLYFVVVLFNNSPSQIIVQQVPLEVDSTNAAIGYL